MSYAIKIESQGPAGMVYYCEQDFMLPFYWESTTVGFDLYLPNLEKWPAFCDEHIAASAKDRRDEIVQRLANEITRHHLGTPRMVLDQTGSLANMKRHDYLPFGEELVPPTGGRSAAQGHPQGAGR